MLLQDLQFVLSWLADVRRFPWCECLFKLHCILLLNDQTKQQERKLLWCSAETRWDQQLLLSKNYCDNDILQQQSLRHWCCYHRLWILCFQEQPINLEKQSLSMSLPCFPSYRIPITLALYEKSTKLRDSIFKGCTEGCMGEQATLEFH